MLTGYTLKYALLPQLTGYRNYADSVIIKMPIKIIYVINAEYAKNAVNFLCFFMPHRQLAILNKTQHKECPYKMTSFCIQLASSTPPGMTTKYITAIISASIAPICPYNRRCFSRYLHILKLYIKRSPVDQMDTGLLVTYILLAHLDRGSYNQN